MCGLCGVCVWCCVQAVDNNMRCVAALTPRSLLLYRLDSGATGGELVHEIPIPNPNGAAPKKVSE